MRRRSNALASAGAGWIVTLLALGVSPAAAAVTLELVTDGLTQPVFMTHARDGSGRLFIVEKFGVIRIYQNGVLLPEPFADLSVESGTGQVQSGSGASEQGLLSMAFAPGFPADDRVCLCYTATGGNTVVARYRIDPNDPNKLDLSTAEVILDQLEPFANHNGGQIEFGPDGYLYRGLGDGGLARDPLFQAQNSNSPLGFLGTIVRIDVSGETGYTVPPTNPYVGDPTVHDEIWAFGLRDPWRFSFDRKTGDLYIADVGQDEWEEINVQPATSTGGENYGWSVYEGTHLYQQHSEVVATATAPTANRDYVFPVLEYDHSEGCSVTGGYVYRSGDPDADPPAAPTIPELYGKYVFGEYCEGTIWAMSETDGVYTKEVLLDTPFGISSFGVDEAGEIYVAHLGIVPPGGAVYKLVPSG